MLGYLPTSLAAGEIDRTPAIHDANLADLRAKYADIATIEEAVTRFTA